MQNYTKPLSLKKHIILSLIIGLLVISYMLIINATIRSFYIQQIKDNANRLAQSYATSLETSNEANEILNSFIEEKIITSGKLMADYMHSLDSEKMSSFAEILNVDEVYLFNPEGVIIQSSSGKYIGWQAYQGHPVHAFMKSDLKTYIEDIRRDSDSDLYYKYGCIKIENGYFVQIGILADKIYEFMDSFTVLSTLNKIEKEEGISSTRFIDNSMQVFSSQERTLSNENSISDEVLESIEKNTKYSNFEYENENSILQVALPVYLYNNKIGTLFVEYDMQQIDSNIFMLNVISISLLFIIFVLLYLIIVSGYRRNKALYIKAHYDDLTGLPNRVLLENKMDSDIKSVGKQKSALILINYRRFKLVNIALGDYYSNKVIKDTAQKLKALNSDKCRLFHISFDRFVFYVKEYSDYSSLEKCANDIINLIKKVNLAKSVGVELGIVDIKRYPANGERLLKYAAVAAANVDENLREGYCFYNSDMDDCLNRQHLIETEIKQILENKSVNSSLQLNFHPIISLKTNKITGFEALARMESAVLGCVSPLEFIDIAEKSKMIYPLGLLILNKACDFSKKLILCGFQGIKVFVNISALQLVNENFIADFFMVLNANNTEAENIGIEVTESVFFDNFDIINQKLAILRDAGIEVAIDDFGTGYSSLARERELNANCLKLDKYFVDMLLEDEPEKAIIGDIIAMAHKQGHLVVAEGVETETQKQYLIEHDCDYMQGYLFSQPLYDEQAIKLLRGQDRNE